MYNANARIAYSNKSELHMGSGHRKRLRTRIINSASGTIDDLSLLEQLLTPSNPRKDVKPIAATLLKEFGSLGRIFLATPEELLEIRGINEIAIAMIKASYESMLSILKKEIRSAPVLKSWKAVLDYLRLSIGNQNTESVRVLFLNKSYKLIKEYVQQPGAADHTTIYTREILKQALSCGAVSLLLAHNHPSGNPLPSEQDLAITKRLKFLLEKISVTIIDHVIVTPDQYFSFASHGLM